MEQLKNSMQINSLRAVLFLILLVVSFVPVFGGEEKEENGGRKQLELVGKEYKFVPDQLRVKTGEKVEIIFKNRGTIAHDFHIKELDFKTDPIHPGKQVSYEFSAPDEPGTLHFECKVAGHAPVGMKGEIIVRKPGTSSSRSDGAGTPSGASAGDRSGETDGSTERDKNDTAAKDFRGENRLQQRLRKRRNVPIKEGWGAVEGTVVLKGKSPDPYKNPGTKTFEKQCGFKGAFEIQYVRIHEETNGIRNTLVYVKNVNSVNRELLPPQTATIVQRNCRFHPPVQVVRTKGTIRLVNRDPAIHNFNYKPSDPFNSTSGNILQKSEKDASEEDTIRIGTSDVYATICNIHPWMNGLFLAVNHNGYDVTNRKGKYHIQLPPGDHELIVRHYTQKKGKTVRVSISKGNVTQRKISLELN